MQEEFLSSVVYRDRQSYHLGPLICGADWPRLQFSLIIFLMRLIVASPPKTGNIWLKNLLIGAYDLKQGDDQPLDTYEDFVEFIKGDRFDDDTVIHLHPEPTDAYFELADSVGATTITILRNPYDVFVSLYHYVQRFKDELADISDPLSEMIDKDLEDEATFDYLMGVRSIENWGRS